jgi:hypothetical protein
VVFSQCALPVHWLLVVVLAADERRCTPITGKK